jgi:hypothetical protein
MQLILLTSRALCIIMACFSMPLVGTMVPLVSLNVEYLLAGLFLTLSL